MNTVHSNKQTVTNPVLLWSKRKLWTVRIVLIVLVGAWISAWLYLHYQIKQGRAKVAQSRIEETRRQEFLRRGAQYKQDVEQRNQAPRVRNVFDGR